MSKFSLMDCVEFCCINSGGGNGMDCCNRVELFFKTASSTPDTSTISIAELKLFVDVAVDELTGSPCSTDEHFIAMALMSFFSRL